MNAEENLSTEKHELIYIGVLILLSILMWLYTNGGGADVADEFIINFLSETNYLLALYFSSEAANAEDYIGCIIVPIAYVFINRMISHFIVEDTNIQKMLRLIANCLLQMLLSICFYGTLERNGSAIWIVFGFVILAIMVICFVMALANARNGFTVIPLWIKYFFTLLIVRECVLVELAFFAQAIVLLLAVFILELLHIAVVMLPLSFVFTPLVLNRFVKILESKVFYRNWDDQRLFEKDKWCCLFAVIVIIVVCIPWGNFFGK